MELKLIRGLRPLLTLLFLKGVLTLYLTLTPSKSPSYSKWETFNNMHERSFNFVGRIE